ncbi:MAG: hypothetical protein PF448_05585 [Bacteroidales bacterium]|jgi:hypothetical protein|nr:hypothetical protein [Bacteroidales bacterium]
MHDMRASGFSHFPPAKQQHKGFRHFPVAASCAKLSRYFGAQAMLPTPGCNFRRHIPTFHRSPTCQVNNETTHCILESILQLSMADLTGGIFNFCIYFLDV